MSTGLSFLGRRRSPFPDGPDPAVPASLAAGPFRGADAVQAGLLTRRRLSGSAWARLFPDIYVYAEIPLTHRVWCEAAALLLPKGSAICGPAPLSRGVSGVSPVTVPERTAFDIARLLPRTDAVVWLDAMLHQHKVYADRLAPYFAAHAGWPGRALADAALTLAEPLTESPMETRLRLLAVDAGLRRPSGRSSGAPAGSRSR